MINYDDYDSLIVAFSGGKDSLACLLHLFEAGVDKRKIELWHHGVDGNPDGSDSELMDWPCTTSYCKAIAKGLRIPLYFSWKSRGFEGEMLRDGQPTEAVYFETPTGLQSAGGDSNQLGTRLLFPQKSGDLSVRWCSAYLKIDVATKALVNDHRFRGRKTLLITGERGEESPNRAKYAELEPHRADARKSSKLQRYIDHYRPVLRWEESQVWEIIKRHAIRLHPAYYLGWGRVSCAACIFGSANQWASLKVVLPEMFNGIVRYETQFKTTINYGVLPYQEGVEEFDPTINYRKKRRVPVRVLATCGTPYPNTSNPQLVRMARDKNWDYPIFVDNWQLPAGAFGESAGPT